MAQVKTTQDLRDRIIELRRIPAKDLRANGGNFRTHPLQQRQLLAATLREIGIAGALLVYHSEREGGLCLIDGHLRQADYPNQSWPCLLTDLTDAEADELLLLYDPMARLAETEHTQYTRLVGTVQSGEAAIQQFLSEQAGQHQEAEQKSRLFDDASIEEVEPQIDHAEELRAHWGVEVGQIWELGGHRLLCGDCTDVTQLTALMAGQVAHMIFTDPPYGVDYDGGMKKQPCLENDMVGTGIYQRAIPLLAQVVDDMASLYLWYADGHAAAAIAAAAAAGYVIVAQIIWAKNHAQFMSSAHYHGKHEACYYGHKHNKSARWHGPGNEVTLWEYPRAAVNTFHPTQKPVALAARAISNSTTQGQIVLDSFLGGGATLVAAEQMERRCYGMEIDPGYVATALQRWADLTGQAPQCVQTLPCNERSTL